VIQRLLEFWLNNIGERGYQGPFLQMLVAAGYTVLHSTRHMPIEFGKDVIALDPQGRLTAFQLKGKPGGLFTHSDLREVQPQLLELSQYAVRFPGREPAVPRPVLVVNAQVDENAQRALDDWNAGELKANPVEVWPYGKLFEMASQLADKLWPTGIPDTKELLKILTEDETGPFPVGAVEDLVLPMLGLEGDAQNWKAPELQRRIASAGLLIGICVARQTEVRNHWAAIQAWTLCAGLIAACAERYTDRVGGTATRMFDLAVGLIDESLVALAQEVMGADDLLVRNSMVEGAIYPTRVQIIAGYLAALWHRGRADGNVAAKEIAAAALSKVPARPNVWGEAAFAPILARVWAQDWLGQHNPDQVRIEMLDLLLACNQSHNPNAFAAPYHDFEEVSREKLQLTGRRGPPFNGFRFDGACYMGLPWFEELVRNNQKQHAKQFWRPLTHMRLMQVDVPEAWQFPLSSADSAKTLTGTLPPRQTWAQVVDVAYAPDVPPLPALLAGRPDLVLLLVLLYPYRATPAVVRYLGLRLGRPWHGFPRRVTPDGHQAIL